MLNYQFFQKFKLLGNDEFNHFNPNSDKNNNLCCEKEKTLTSNSSSSEDSDGSLLFPKVSLKILLSESRTEEQVWALFELFFKTVLKNMFSRKGIEYRFMLFLISNVFENM